MSRLLLTASVLLGALAVCCSEREGNGSVSSPSQVSFVDLDELPDSTSLWELFCLLGQSQTEMFLIEEPAPVGRAPSISKELRVHYAPTEAAVEFLLEDQQLFYVTAVRGRELVWARGEVSHSIEGYGLGEGMNLEWVWSKDWFALSELKTVLQPGAGVGLWMDTRLSLRDARTALAACASAGATDVALQGLSISLPNETFFGYR